MEIVIDKKDNRSMVAFKNAILEEAEQDEFYKEAINKCPAKWEDLFNYIASAVRSAKSDAMGYTKISGGACVDETFVMPVAKEFFVDYEAREAAKQEKIKKDKENEKKQANQLKINELEKVKKHLEKGLECNGYTLGTCEDTIKCLKDDVATVGQIEECDKAIKYYNENYVNVKPIKPTQTKIEKRTADVVAKHEKETKKEEKPAGFAQTSLFDFI